VTVYLRPIDAERAQPCCTECNWAGTPDSDRRAAAAAYAHEQTCPGDPATDDGDTDSESENGAS
jgi:hypothetical protein